MYYQVISYNSKNDVIDEHRITQSKSEAFRWFRDAESQDGIQCVHLLADVDLPKYFNMDNRKEFLNFVADFMLNIGCSLKVAEWISYQFALESNFGQSRLAKTRHNLCGMKIPTCRPSTNIAVSGEFAKYRTLFDCLLDYALWLSYVKFTSYDLTHLDLFVLKIKAKGYCPEDDYVERINNLINNTKL